MKSKKILKHTVLFEPSDKGYVVYIPSLPGCVTQGDTLKEAVRMAKDAIIGYLEVLKIDNNLISKKQIQ